MTKRRRT